MAAMLGRRIRSVAIVALVLLTSSLPALASPGSTGAGATPGAVTVRPYLGGGFTVSWDPAEWRIDESGGVAPDDARGFALINRHGGGPLVLSVSNGPARCAADLATVLVKALKAQDITLLNDDAGAPISGSLNGFDYAAYRYVNTSLRRVYHLFLSCRDLPDGSALTVSVLMGNGAAIATDVAAARSFLLDISFDAEGSATPAAAP